MIQSSLVTACGRVVHAGPTWYHGFAANRDPGRSGVTLVITDSAQSAVTGSDVLDWCYIHSGSSVVGNYINTRSDKGIKIISGLRSQIIDGRTGGVTCVIYWS